MYHLSEAAKNYGFDTLGYNIDFEKLISSDLNLPFISNVIINNSYLHFVVVYKIDLKRKIITIMDPSRGFKKYSFEDYKKIFNNKILIVIPKTKIALFNNNYSFINSFIEIIKSEKYLTRKIFLSNLLLIIFSIISGLYFKIGLNIISDYNNIKMLTKIVFIFLFVYIIKNITYYLKDYYENYINKNIDIKIIIPFLNHLILLPLDYAYSKTTGEILTRVNELNNIKDLFSKIFVTFILNIGLALSALCILMFINKTICFILCFVLVLYFIITYAFSNSIYNKVRKNIEYEGEFNNNVIENVKGLSSIKELNSHAYFISIITNRFIRYLKDSFNIKIFLNKINILKNFVYDIGIFIINSICLYYVIKEKLTIIDLITINSIIIYITDPIKNLIDLIPNINFLKASISKISDFLLIEQEKLGYSNEKFINGDIEIKNLNYSYNNYHQCLQNLNIKINKNEHIMLYGNSGCGKSTICKIIARLIDGHKGNVLVGGINILDYQLSTIRKNITYLSQNEYLFSDTIKNNLLLGKNIPINYLENVIKICRLENVINKKPLRLETTIDNDNYLFSGGERQRLLLARSLLKKSSILILDEALSEVEDCLEKEIIKDILNIYKNKTIIYVTHKKYFKLFERVIYV